MKYKDHVIDTLAGLMLAASNQGEQGQRLYQHDSPIRRTLGFRTETDCWVIRLVDVKKSLQDIEPEALKTVISRWVGVPEGRQVLFGCEADPIH